MYSSVVPSWRDRDVDAEHARHRLHDVVDADRRAGREIDGAASARGAHQRQEPVDRIVDVHEVDEVLAVAAQRELALAGHDARAATAS